MTSDGYMLILQAGAVEFFRLLSEVKGEIMLLSKQKLQANDGIAWSAEFNPDGICLASTGQDKKIRVWKETNGSFSPVFVSNDSDFGHTRTVRRLSWRPDSELLAAVSFDSTCSLWRKTPNGELSFITKLSGQENEVKGVSFSPCGEMLATCSRDKSIWIFDVSSLLERRASGSSEFQKVVAGDHTNQEGDFVMPSSPSVLRERVRAEDIECLAVLEGHSQDVKAVKFSPHDSHMLVSVSYDDSVKIWRSTTSDDWELSETLRGHSGTVWDVAFNPTNPDEFATVSADGSMKIWSRRPAPPRIKASDTYLLTGPLGVTSRRHRQETAFSAVSETWSCQTVQVTTSQVENFPPQPVYSIDWTEQGFIALGCGDNTVRIYYRRDASILPVSTVITASEPTSVSFNPRVPTELAVALEDGSLNIYELKGVEDYLCS